MRKHVLFIIISLLTTCNVFSQSNFRNEWIDFSKTYYKFKVYFGSDATGIIRRKLIRLNKDNLDQIGLGNIPANQFQLFRNGKEIPLFTTVSNTVLGVNDYIEFIGEINNGEPDNDLYRDADFQLNNTWSLFEDSSSYFLTVNTAYTNKRYSNASFFLSGSTIAPSNYVIVSTLSAQRNNFNPGFAAQAAQLLYSSSFDRGEGLMSRSIRPLGSSCRQVSYNIGFTNLKPYLSGPSMTFKLNATGNANNARTILVKLNGDTISNFQMDYFNYIKIEETGINTAKIATGSATINFTNQSIVDCDEFKIATAELIYPSLLDANGAKNFEFSLPAKVDGHYLKFYNFNYSGSSPVLYDLTNNKRYIGDTSITDTIRFITDPLSVGAKFMLVKSSDDNAYFAPNFTPKTFTNFAAASNQGNYLIISNPLIFGTGSSNYVEQYRQYRSSSNGGGFNAKLIDINELVDQFAYGIDKHPLSIRNFLKFARAAFNEPPKFAFLIGKGLDYIQYRSNWYQPDISYQNLVPSWGHPASDNLLSAADNSSAFPATPIGRLSAVSANEVGDYLTKIKQYDSLQRSTSSAIQEKAWMKNVLQVAGANDVTLASKLDGYLNAYKKTIQDTVFGGLVKNYDRLNTTSNYATLLKDFKQTYESGASLITYFGHSSATNLDFSLDNPSAYNNQYKYPVFVVNGCDAGNFFVYEPQRQSLKSTISEKFILEPQRGAIGYLATTGFGVVNYLDSFTRKLYQSISQTDYNKPFGVLMQSTINKLLNNTGFNDYFARIHTEQFLFHGDPALKLNGYDLPDYAIEAANISATPAFISVADDSFFVKAKIYSLGKKTADSINIKVTRQYPLGSTSVVYTKKIPSINGVDSIQFALPILSTRDKGNNLITIIVDDNNAITELSETNNTASITVQVRDDEIRPIYPYNYAIINNTNFKFAASTANPLAASKSYIIEVDTTALFNSPLKYTQTKTSIGGVIEFDNGISLQSNTTYYWRVALQSAEQKWNNFSFTYKNGTEVGFSQQHFYQHTQSSFDRIYLDSASRKLKYQNKLNNLFMLHSIYPYSGTEDQQFSIQVNGAGIIASACLGRSVIINVFDTLTFRPWENLTNPFGAEPTCDVSRKYNFEYAYYDSTYRNQAYQFLNAIPNGYLVAVRLIYDGDYVWADEWAKDSVPYGPNNTLYAFLKKQGLPIDSFNAPRTFGFIFKKNDSTRFSPRYQFTNGLYDRVTMSVDFDGVDTLGYIQSPKFGPAKAWKRVIWNGAGSANNIARVNVVGISKTGQEATLLTLDQTQQNVDISSISTTQYPYLKLYMQNQDSITAVPYQLADWRIEYEGVGEGALAPNFLVNLPDSAGIGLTVNPSDTLKLAIAFKNVSKINLDSLNVKLVLTQQFGTGAAFTFNLPKTKAIAAGDSVEIRTSLFVKTMPEGNYNLYWVINENGAAPEQYLFNNFLNKYVFLKTNIITPVRILDFYAKRAAGNSVQLNWTVANEQNLQAYQVQHSTDGVNFTQIGLVQAMQSNYYNFLHTNAAKGKNYYRLKLQDNDGRYNYSPVRLINISSNVVINIYPNPVVNSLNIAISNTNAAITAKLLNAVGQQLFVQTFAANTEIDMRKFAAGTYYVQIEDGVETKIFKIQKQ